MTEQATSIVKTNGHGERLGDSGPAAHELLFAPNVDIFENEREILIDADFPGVPQDALLVQIEGSQLTLEGRRPGYVGWAGPSRVRRTFRIPETVDPNRVEAEMKHGVLRVRLCKREDTLPRRIQVRSVG